MKKKKKTRTVPVPKFAKYLPSNYMEMQPAEFIVHIREESNKAMRYLRKAGKQKADLRELLVRWGEWSRTMNTILRNHINKTMPFDPVKMASYDKLVMHYKIAYAYWWNRAHYLETYRKSFLGGLADRKKIDEGKKNLEYIINNNLEPEMVKKYFDGLLHLVDKLSVKKELDERETEDALDGKETRTNDF